MELYINSLSQEISSEFKYLILSVWEKIKDVADINGVYLTIPDACLGENDNFMFTWANNEHYLECEIFSTGAVEFFYRNKITKDVWGDDINLNDILPMQLINKIFLFTNFY